MTDVLTLPPASELVEPGVFEFPATVIVARDNQPKAKMRSGIPSDAILLERARVRANDPTFFDEKGDPFFFSAEISNDRVDSYYTTMDVTSLQNYADDAEEGPTGNGVPLLNTHNRKDSEIGRSLFGRYFDKRGADRRRVVADFFIPRGIKVIRGGGAGLFGGGQSGEFMTDEVIDQVRAGTRAATSIGFIPGQFICSICNREMLQGLAAFFADPAQDCIHIPGMKYEKVDAKGKPTGEMEVAIARVLDARLAENSLVTAGACPGAAIIKAQRMADARNLPFEARRWIETTYHVRLAGPQRLWNGVGQIGSKPKEVRTVGEITLSEEAFRRLVDCYPEQAREWEGIEAGEVATRLAAKITADRKTLADTLHELEQLKPLAEDARAERKELIEEALKEGRTAIGKAFREEGYRRYLEAPSTSREDIKAQRDSWRSEADEWTRQGRIIRPPESNGDGKQADEAAKNERVPAAAHWVP